MTQVLLVTDFVRAVNVKASLSTEELNESITAVCQLLIKWLANNSIIHLLACPCVEPHDKGCTGVDTQTKQTAT